MNFWRWYLSKLSVGRVSRQCFSANSEFAAGIVIAALGLIIAPLGIITSGAMPLALLWFIVLIPIGITMVFHGYWRESKRK